MDWSKLESQFDKETVDLLKLLQKTAKEKMTKLENLKIENKKLKEELEKLKSKKGKKLVKKPETKKDVFNNLLFRLGEITEQAEKELEELVARKVREQLAKKGLYT